MTNAIFSTARRSALLAAVIGAAFALQPAIASAAGSAGITTAATSASTATTATAAAVSQHQTAPTQFVDAAGTRLAYRRFGKRGGVPLLFLQHFVGTLDSWDPQVVDGLAHGREVILFDNAGVASSQGEVPATVEGMAAHAINLLKALGVDQADLLGFSLGSLVAQQVTVERPDLVRKLILVGSGPRGGAGMASLTPEFTGFLGKKRAPADDLLLDVFFTPSAASQAAGHAFLKRIYARKVNRDIDINDKVVPAQVAAFAAWGAPQANANAYLKKITQPVLVVSGDDDIVHYTVNALTLKQHLPNAQLSIYPDANHGAAYQYPALFVQQVSGFLDGAK